jgi:hypothetical protein
MGKLSVCAALAVLPVAAAAQGRVGPEFQVNEATAANQSGPAASFAGDGSFVVVWSSTDGSVQGVFARRYAADGLALTGEFQVNTYTTGSQTAPTVASGPDGDFVVVWSSADADGDGIFGRRFDASGTPIGGEFPVNAYTTGNQTSAALAADSDGSFVVVWGGVRGGDTNGLSGRRFDASATPLAADFPLNSATVGGQQRPAVVMTGGGTFVAVWESTVTGLDVYARQFDASAVPLGVEFRVNSYTTDNQWFPSVAARRGGGFVAAWSSSGQDGDGRGIFLKTFSATGLGGPEFQVNTYTTGDQPLPKVAGDAAGNFAVLWHGDGPGDTDGVFGRYYLAPGTPAGPEFLVNTHTASDQGYASVAMAADGDFVVAWESEDQDGEDDGAFAQRFAPELIFADTFDSGTLADWSASATSGGDLAVTAAAGLAGSSRGLSAVVDDTSGRWVQDDTPDDESRYRARFYFDPNGFDPGEALDHRRIRLFVAFEENPNRRLAAVVLRRLNGDYALGGRARQDDDSQHDTGFFPITDDEHFVEIDWRRASGPDGNDGFFEMWIDGTSVYATASLDNSISGVDFARLGALSAKEAASGTLYWDQFDSRRTTYIGQDPR